LFHHLKDCKKGKGHEAKSENSQDKKQVPEPPQAMKTLLTSQEKESSQEEQNAFGSFGNAVPTDKKSDFTKNRQEDSQPAEDERINVRSPKINIGKYSKDKNQIE
jgi:hypothetical protein